MIKSRYLKNDESSLKIGKEDYFDKKIKPLMSQRIKHYIYDVARVFNVTASPFHFYRRKAGFFKNKKINLGCGTSYVEGWVNVDGNPFRKKDMWLDLRRKWPFANYSINGIVAAHIIEHFFDEELYHFFRELSRVLKPGGFIHLEVPSLELLVKRYIEDKNGFRFNLIAHWHGAHHQLFDFERLVVYLSKYGFHEFTKFLGKKKSKYLSNEEIDKICLRPEETLIVEALRR